MGDMDNAASEKKVKKMVGREERLAHRQHDDMKYMLSTVNGRRVLWRILEKCGVFRSVHHPSGSQVYYNAGQQDVGHFVLTMILDAEPKKFLDMQLEAKDYENV